MTGLEDRREDTGASGSAAGPEARTVARPVEGPVAGDTSGRTAGAGSALLITLLIGISFALIWSSAFSVAKMLVTHSPPFAISAIRFALAAMLAGGLALALGQPFPRRAGAWRAIALLGLCQNTLYLGFFFTAMTVIPAGLAAIIASAMPLIVAAVAPRLLGERLGWARVAGIALGFGGVVWIMGSRVVGGVDLGGLGLAILGTLALATATLTVKRTDFGTGLLMVVACQMGIGALGCVPLALLFEDVTAWDWTDETVPFLAPAFAYAVLFPGIVATLLWFVLVKRVSAAGASTFHFLNPVFGVGFAFLFLAEPVSARDAVGVAAVAAGILIVNRARG
ncbi:MAG: DMT family transporter [Pseudomonadota bacterium]